MKFQFLKSLIFVLTLSEQARSVIEIEKGRVFKSNTLHLAIKKLISCASITFQGEKSIENMLGVIHWC